MNTDYRHRNDTGSDKQLYVAPRRAAAMYDDDQEEVKKQKIQERLKSKIEKSKLLKELRSEFSDKPEERKDYNTISNNDVDLETENKERQEYEEEYMTRLVMSKKDKQRRKRALEGRNSSGIDNIRQNGLHEIEDYEALDRLIQSTKDDGADAEWDDKDRRMRKTLQKLEQEQRKGGINGRQALSGGTFSYLFQYITATKYVWWNH